MNVDFLKKEGVTHIVNTAKGLEIFGPKYTVSEFPCSLVLRLPDLLACSIEAGNEVIKFSMIVNYMAALHCYCVLYHASFKFS